MSNWNGRRRVNNRIAIGWCHYHTFVKKDGRAAEKLNYKGYNLHRLNSRKGKKL